MYLNMTCLQKVTADDLVMDEEEAEDLMVDELEMVK
tara:strand:- start:49 stop:156 length:108 start_codon:yes stop_codon:yes gene_type:complete